MDNEDYICIKRMTVALLITFSLVSGFLVVLGVMGYANTLEESVFGAGTFSARHDTDHASDQASVVNATGIAYELERHWGVSGEYDTFSSSFIVNGADPSGRWKNKYVIKASGAGHKVVLQATKISGDASFASDITFILKESGEQDLDSSISFDTRDGNATITGNVWNSTSGRPATMEELAMVGQFALTHHLNISLEEITPDNWLGFCSELDRDMILDKTIKTGVYIAPAGYELDESDRLVPKVNSTV